MIYIYNSVANFFDDYINSIVFTYKSVYLDKKIEYITDLSIVKNKIKEKNHMIDFYFYKKF